MDFYFQNSEKSSNQKIFYPGKKNSLIKKSEHSTFFKPNQTVNCDSKNIEFSIRINHGNNSKNDLSPKLNNFGEISKYNPLKNLNDNIFQNKLENYSEKIINLEGAKRILTRKLESLSYYLIVTTLLMICLIIFDNEIRWQFFPSASGEITLLILRICSVIMSVCQFIIIIIQSINQGKLNRIKKIYPFEFKIH